MNTKWSTGEVKQYPNPFKHLAKVMINSSATSEVEINIFDMTGKRLKTYSHSVKEGLYEFEIGERLKSGIYIVQVISGTKVETKRIIKN